MATTTCSYIESQKPKRVLVVVLAVVTFSLLAANLWLRINAVDWVAYTSLMSVVAMLGDMARSSCPECDKAFGDTRLPWTKSCVHCGLSEDGYVQGAGSLPILRPRTGSVR
jgi:hypothetical protein